MIQSTTFIQHTLPYKALGDSFLPLNNNSEYLSFADTVTATIVDKDNSPVGFGSLIQCNAKQAYVMLGEVAPHLKSKAVTIQKCDSHSNSNLVYEVDTVQEIPDYSGETLFEQAFADRDERPVHQHLIEILINSSVGLANMNITKNITVDFEKNTTIHSWRDFAGFIVTENKRFSRIVLNRFELLSLAEETKNVESVVPEKIVDIVDYDSTVSLFDREAHIEALVKTSGVKTQLARDETGEVVGYIVYTDRNILQCYGNDENIQKELLSSAAQKMNSSTVTMFICNDKNKTMNDLSQRAIETTQITRLNTTCVVNTIKWNKIACLNMGLHMF